MRSSSEATRATAMSRPGQNADHLEGSSWRAKRLVRAMSAGSAPAASIQTTLATADHTIQRASVLAGTGPVRRAAISAARSGTAA